ncbi:MAG: 23S rRNA (uracil(1939)-C(5))-methyltransferase RlmD [Thermodesulfobacteriota bacterium]|nr:23S rRNA (uracil(1939)-C(5))-methyltransferase RlmD [Thermodesulfobacteriota bacterium]
MVKIGDVATLKLDTVAFGGNAVGRINNVVVFVPFAVDGDEVIIEIKEVKKNYCTARIEKIFVPSPERVEARCPYFTICGGCQYQHISYKHQLEIKEKQVAESFERIGKVKSPPVRQIIPSPLVYNYRGKAEFHIDFDDKGNPRIGFIDEGGAFPVDIERCEIVDETINDAVKSLRADIASGRRNIDEKRNIFWSHTGFLAAPFISRTVKGGKFRVPYSGFFQTNLSLVDRLVDTVLMMGDFDVSHTVLDCYCGSGLFSLFLAPRVKRIFGIEGDGQSVECARANLRDHGLTNAEFIKGNVEKILQEKVVEGEMSFDAVLLDPPRIGCARKVLDTIAEIRPAKIVYVSCDPVTQARDIRYLMERGFSLRELQPIDMFPQTKHIEVIAVMEKQ